MQDDRSPVETICYCFALAERIGMQRSDVHFTSFGPIGGLIDIRVFIGNETTSGPATDVIASL